MEMVLVVLFFFVCRSSVSAAAFTAAAAGNVAFYGFGCWVAFGLGRRGVI